MPLDIISQDSEELWRGFGQYVTAPYLANDFARPALQKWFQDLYDRKKASEDLYLDFVANKSQVTGKEFYSFRLNETLYVSHKAAVLTMPFPRTTSYQSGIGVPPACNVGIHLRDYGDLSFAGDDFRKVLSEFDDYQQRRFSVLDKRFPYLRSIAEQMTDMLQEGLVARGSVDVSAKTMLDAGEIRFAKSRPIAMTWHPDLDNERNEGDVWKYILTHPFLRKGTLFDATRPLLPDSPVKNRKTVTIECPLFATSAHIALRIHQRQDLLVGGSQHLAQGHTDGRGVIIFPEGKAENATWQPIRDMEPIWGTTPCNYSPSLA